MKKYRLVLMFMLIIANSVFAGPLDDIKNVYKKYHSNTNLSKPSVLNSQRGGHLVLGGLSNRVPTQTLSPVSVSAPGFRMGCNGQDWYWGSFSYIKMPQLKEFFNNVLGAGVNYGFMIGLETLCPNCKKQMDKMSDIAREINKFSLDSCHSAAQVLGGMLPATQATQKYLCPQLAQGSGLVTDMAAANQKCGALKDNGSGDTEVYSRARQHPNTKEILDQFLVDKGNLAWMVLQKRKFSNAGPIDDQLRELAMSFTGSVILTSSDKHEKKYTYLPSLAGDKALYEAMLRGGEAAIYRCGDGNEKKLCLNPTLSTTIDGKDVPNLITISRKNSFVGQVEEILYKIKDKYILDNGELSDEEENLIKSTKKIPLLKALNAQAAHSFVFEVIDLSQYAEIIAVDMIEDYINELIDIVRLGIKHINIGKEESNKFEQDLQNAKRLLQYRKTNIENENRLTFDFINKVRLIEQMTADDLSAEFLQMAKWSSNMGGN